MGSLRREKVWTKDKLKYLNENYSKHTPQQIADVLGVSKNAVRAKAFELGLKSKRTICGIWTDEKIEYLKNHYATDTNISIAKELGCSNATVKAKAKKLGLCKKQKELKDRYSESRKKKCYYGPVRGIGKNKNEVTNATRTLVCSCALDNVTVHQTALLTSRTDAQIKEILEDCKASGYFDWIKKRRKNLAMEKLGE